MGQAQGPGAPRPSWTTHLAVEGEEAEAADGREEEGRHGDLDDVGGHDAELLEPDGQLVGVPGSWRGDALRLVVVGQGCGHTAGPRGRRSERGRCLARRVARGSGAGEGQGAGADGGTPPTDQAIQSES